MSKWQGCLVYPSTLTTPATYSTHLIHTYDLPTATIADRAAFARVRAGLTYPTLAAAMRQHRETIAASLSSPLRMRADRFAAFCSACHTDHSWILHGDDPPPLLDLPGSTIGDRIRACRAHLGLSTRAMARLCGISQSASITAWENGRNVPLVSSLLSISAAFGINAASFLPPP